MILTVGNEIQAPNDPVLTFTYFTESSNLVTELAANNHNDKTYFSIKKLNRGLSASVPDYVHA